MSETDKPDGITDEDKVRLYIPGEGSPDSETYQEPLKWLVSVRVKTEWSERSSGAKLSWLSDDKGPWQSEEKKGTQRNEEGRDQGSENGVQEGSWENFWTGRQVESQDGNSRGEPGEQ